MSKYGNCTECGKGLQQHEGYHVCLKCKKRLCDKCASVSTICSKCAGISSTK